MDRSKGVAYCGLACCVCSENATCAGCRNAGCSDKESCKSFNCCKKKGLNGCWECEQFPCENPMFKKTRVRAFANFIGEYGENILIELLAKNEAIGMRYHYKGQLVGDYDVPQTEGEIMNLIARGK